MICVTDTLQEQAHSADMLTGVFHPWVRVRVAVRFTLQVFDRPHLGPAFCTLGLASLFATVPAYGQVSGDVRDAVSKAPIQGAEVRVQGDAEGTTTDQLGNFKLSASPRTGVLITAAKKGYYTAGVDATNAAASLEILLEAVGDLESPNYQVTAPSTCGDCHVKQRDDWARSAMAHAGENRWVHDAYNGGGTANGSGGFVYTRDSALAVENPASECASCHQPERWVSEPFSPLQPYAEAKGRSRGVSCDICHKIADIDETKTNFPGLYPGVVRFSKPDTNQAVVYGLLGDVTFNRGPMRAAVQPQLPAAVCAACHQDKNDPDLNGNFEEENGIVSEPTYQEWSKSEYADSKSPRYATCATCHMKPSFDTQACTVEQMPYVRPEGEMRRHTFQGTTAEYLDNAVSLTLNVEKRRDELVVTVAIHNDRTGHSVPTGVTIRNMILLVDATQDDAPLEYWGTQVVNDLGGVGDPALGYFAGLPGKLYAKAIFDSAGNMPTFYTDAAGILFDNRIGPLEKDTTEYRFPLKKTGGLARVSARLIYRRAFRALVDAKQWTEDGHGNPLEDVSPPHFGHLMAQKEVLVQVPPLPDNIATGKHQADTDPGSSCSLAFGQKPNARSGFVLLAFLIGVFSVRSLCPKRLRK